MFVLTTTDSRVVHPWYANVGKGPDLPGFRLPPKTPPRDDMGSAEGQVGSGAIVRLRGSYRVWCNAPNVH